MLPRFHKRNRLVTGFQFGTCRLYLKTRTELKKQEKIYLIEFKQLPVTKIEVAKHKGVSKEVLSSNPSY